jgi:MFS family permease
MAQLIIVIVVMLIQQALSYMSCVVLPNMAPLVAQAIHTDPNLIGYHTGIFYLASSIWQLSSGGFIIRFGPIRMSQFSLMIIGIGLIMGIAGKLWVFAAAAALMGTGASFSTPSSSHLLARYSPPRYAPLIFSIKQTGVPVGGLMAGTMVPLLLVIVGWQGAFMVTGALCIVFALILQPMRDRFDIDRDPDHPLKPVEIWNNLNHVLHHSELRDLALAMFCFVGLQGLFGSYFVTVVTRQLETPLSVANHIFSLAMSAAIFARILWGWVGSRFIPARVLLGILALVMVVASVGTGLYNRSWSIPMVAVVAVLYCISAIGWHGLLLSEIARLAPKGNIGGITGAVLAFGGSGMMSFPVIYAQIVNATGNYSIGFYFAAIPALLIGFRLFKRIAPETAPLAELEVDRKTG